MRRTALLFIALFASSFCWSKTIKLQKLFVKEQKKTSAVFNDDRLCIGEQLYTAIRDDMAAEALPHILKTTSKSLPTIRTGLCLSGGSIRAVMADAGVLRALKEIGVLDACSHISSLSGSCFFLIAWLLSQADPTQFAEKLYPVFANASRIPRINEVGNLAHMVGRLISRTIYPTFHSSYKRLPISELQTLADPARYPYPLWSTVSRYKAKTDDSYYWFDVSPHQTRMTSPDDDIFSWETGLFGSVFKNGYLHKKKQELSLVQLTAICGAFFKESLSVSIPNPLYNIPHHPARKHKKAILRDAGYANNIPLTPLLTPQRDLDLIIVFDAGKTPVEDLDLALNALSRRYPIARWSKKIEEETLKHPIVYLPAPTSDGVNILYISLAPDKKFLDKRDGLPFDPRDFSKNPHCKTENLRFSARQARQMSDRMYTTITKRKALVRYAFLDTVRKRMNQFSITPQPRQTSLS